MTARHDHNAPKAEGFSGAFLCNGQRRHEQKNGECRKGRNLRGGHGGEL